MSGTEAMEAEAKTPKVGRVKRSNEQKVCPCSMHSTHYPHNYDSQDSWRGGGEVRNGEVTREKPIYQQSVFLVPMNEPLL